MKKPTAATAAPKNPTTTAQRQAQPTTASKPAQTTSPTSPTSTPSLTASSASGSMDDITDLLSIDPSSLDFTQVDADLETFQQDPVVQGALSRGVDLRSYSQQIETDLNDAEVDFLSALLSQTEAFGDIYSQLLTCDNTLDRMNDILETFQSKLHEISNEIHTLQQLSVTLSVELCNRKSVHKRLNCYTKNSYLPPDLVNTICTPVNPNTTASNAGFGSTLQQPSGGLLGGQQLSLSDAPVNQQLVNYLPMLTNIVLFHACPQVKTTQPAIDMIPVLYHVYSRALIRSRNSLMSWVNELKKPTINIFVKQSQLLKFRQCYDFLLLHCGSTFVDELTRVSYDNDHGNANAAHPHGSSVDDTSYTSRPNVAPDSHPSSIHSTNAPAHRRNSQTGIGNSLDDSNQLTSPTLHSPFNPSQDPHSALTNSGVIMSMDQIESYVKSLGDLSQEVRAFYVSVMSYVYFQHFKTYTNATLKLQQTSTISADDLIGGEHDKPAQLKYQSGIDPHNTSQSQSKSSWFKLSWGGSSTDPKNDPKKAKDYQPITPDFFQSPSLYFRPKEFESISPLLQQHHKLIPQLQRQLAQQYPSTTTNPYIPFEPYNILSLLSFSHTAMHLSILPSIRAFSVGQRDLVLSLSNDTIVLPATTNQSAQQAASGQPTYLNLNPSLLPPSALPNHHHSNSNRPDNSNASSTSFTPAPSAVPSGSSTSKLPFERLFRSALHLLVDTCIAEYSFIHQFFGASSVLQSQAQLTQAEKDAKEASKRDAKKADPATMSTIRSPNSIPSPRSQPASSSTLTIQQLNGSDPKNPYIAHMYDSIFEQHAEEEAEYENLQHLLRTVRSHESDDGNQTGAPQLSPVNSAPKPPQMDVIKQLANQCQDRITTLSSALLPFRVQQAFTQFSLVFQRIFQSFIDILDQYSSQCHDVISLFILLQIIYIYDAKIRRYHVLSSCAVFLSKLSQLLLKRIESLLDQQIASIRYVVLSFGSDLDWFQQESQGKTVASTATKDSSPTASALPRLRGYISHIVMITYKYVELVAAIRKFEQFYTNLSTYHQDSSTGSSSTFDESLPQQHVSVLPNMIQDLQHYVVQLNREYETLIDTTNDLILRISSLYHAQLQKTTGFNSASMLTQADLNKYNGSTLVSFFNTQVNHLILCLMISRQQNSVSTTINFAPTPQPASKTDKDGKFLTAPNTHTGHEISVHQSLYLTPEFKSRKKLFFSSLQSLSEAILRKYFSHMLEFVHTCEGFLNAIEKAEKTPNATSTTQTTVSKEITSSAAAALAAASGDDNSNTSVSGNKLTPTLTAFAQYLFSLSENDFSGFDLIVKQFFVTQQQWKDALVYLLQEAESLSYSSDTSKLTFTQISIALQPSTSPSSSTTTSTSGTSEPSTQAVVNSLAAQKEVELLLGADLVASDFASEDVGPLIINAITKSFLLYFVRYTDVLKHTHEVFKKSSTTSILQSQSVDISRTNIIRQRIQEYIRRTVTIHSLLAEIKKYAKAGALQNTLGGQDDSAH